MPRNSDGPLASHVKTAIAAGQGKRTGQAKMSGQGGGRGMAAHVRAAIAAAHVAGQPKMGGPPARSGTVQRSSKYTKTTEYYKDLYDEYLDDEYYAEKYIEDELWGDETRVWDYALRELNKKGYKNWDETDSSQGNYCRFIWFLSYGITVGVNVHYTGGGKAAGNMYIQGIPDCSQPTPQMMVTAAPASKPATTLRWRDL